MWDGLCRHPADTRWRGQRAPASRNASPLLSGYWRPRKRLGWMALEGRLVTSVERAEPAENYS